MKSTKVKPGALYDITLTGKRILCPEGIEGTLSWLKLQYPCFRKGESCVLFYWHEIPHSPLFDHVFDVIDQAIFNVELMDKSTYFSRAHGNFPLEIIREMAQEVCEAVENYKREVDEGRTVKPNSNIARSRYYNPAHTALDNGEALIDFVQTPKGRKFVVDFGKRNKIGIPLPYVLSLQVLLDFELFVCLLLKQESKLESFPKVPKACEATWRDRALGILNTNICKLSVLANEFHVIHKENQTPAENGRRKGEALRNLALAWHEALQNRAEITIDEKNALEKQIARNWSGKTAWAAIIAKLILRSEKDGKILKQEKITSEERLQARIQKLLENQRLPCEKQLYNTLKIIELENGTSQS